MFDETGRGKNKNFCLYKKILFKNNSYLKKINLNFA